MGATFVAARDERYSCSFQFLERFHNVLAATDLRRIALRAEQDKIVVHHGIALDAVTLRKKLLLGGARVHEYDVGIAMSRKVERLPCSHGHDVHFDPCLPLDERKKV